MTFPRLERCLLPAPQYIRWEKGNLHVKNPSLQEKVTHCTKNFFTLLVLTPLIPLTLSYDAWAHRNVSVLSTPKRNLEPIIWPPQQRGFATSLFQTTGMGTKWAATPALKGKCDWDKWMDDPKHILHQEGFNYRNFFTDILSNPEPYIAMLKAHNVTAHRLSLEWSVIEPEPGVFDEKAIALYQDFIKKLQEAGISISFTLSHFVLPEWFYERGGFQKTENVDFYLRFALKALELFPTVTDWWSFNELGVKAFQQAREVYPTDLPEGSSLSARVHAAGIATRNMLIAHCRLHMEAAKLFPDKKIGVTHQWLKFDTASNNVLERILAYYFTKFAFTPVYQFFKTGTYSFEFPFMANIQFEIDKEEFAEKNHFLTHLGVQAYPKPMVKMGLNHGETYPGPPSAIKNFPLFSFGSSCEPGGTVMRFGPRCKAEGMNEILDEAFTLTPNVSITEFGGDANVQKWGEPEFKIDDEAQANFIQQLVETVHAYCQKTGKSIQGLFTWSDLRRQMEWDNGAECTLGTIKPIVDPETRQMTGWEETPASNYLAKAFA